MNDSSDKAPTGQSLADRLLDQIAADNRFLPFISQRMAYAVGLFLVGAWAILAAILAMTVRGTSQQGLDAAAPPLTITLDRRADTVSAQQAPQIDEEPDR